MQIVAFPFLSSVRKIFKVKCVSGYLSFASMGGRQRIAANFCVADESVENHNEKFKADSKLLSKRDIPFLARRRERSLNKGKLRREKKDIHNC